MATRSRPEIEAAVAQVAARFAIEGELRALARLGRGHIHDTFELRFEGAGSPRRVVLQRVNDRVFRVPLDVMRNVALVTAHLRRKLVAAGQRDPERHCLRLIESREGAAHVEDADGAIWRAYPFIEGSVALERPASDAQAFTAARAFGNFVHLLADLPPARLAETIPDFHDLPGRYAALEVAIERNAAGRGLAELAPDFDQSRWAFRTLRAALQALGPLPSRVVHNDCKLNNVLLDARSGAALCVIDLDTVMEGTLLADFGDLVRTASNPAPEDERDLSRVDFDLARFDALARGYVRGLAGGLASREAAALPLAGPALALENALRFLTDYLDGDVYFPAHREHHNLDRARAQLRLVEVMWARRASARARVEAALSSTPTAG